MVSPVPKVFGKNYKSLNYFVAQLGYYIIKFGSIKHARQVILNLSLKRINMTSFGLYLNHIFLE